MAESSNQTQSHAAGSPTILALLGASLAALGVFFSTGLKDPTPTPAVPVAKLPASEPAEPTAPTRDVHRAVFFDNEVEPRIAEADKLNREAADRCVQRIVATINQYRRGVDPFVEDLTSMSTRFGIVKRMPADWWRKDQRVDKYVKSKFEQHLFSEKKLMDDIGDVLKDFKVDIDANQKRMLISVKTALGSADLPEVQADEYQPFFEAVARQLQQHSTVQGTASVQNALGAFVLGEVGFFAGRSIVAGLLARFGSGALAGAAASAGATATGTAAGTGAGSLGGPVGAAVGFGVGLAVGMVIDWWLTDKFQERLSQQMNSYLDTLGNTILYGGATQYDPSTPIQTAENQTGLVDALPIVCDRLKEAYRERFYEQIVTGAPTP